MSPQKLVDIQLQIIEQEKARKQKERDMIFDKSLIMLSKTIDKHH